MSTVSKSRIITDALHCSIRSISWKPVKNITWLTSANDDTQGAVLLLRLRAVWYLVSQIEVNTGDQHHLSRVLPAVLCCDVQNRLLSLRTTWIWYCCTVAAVSFLKCAFQSAAWMFISVYSHCQRCPGHSGRLWAAVKTQRGCWTQLSGGLCFVAVYKERWKRKKDDFTWRVNDPDNNPFRFSLLERCKNALSYIYWIAAAVQEGTLNRLSLLYQGVNTFIYSDSLK